MSVDGGWWWNKNTLFSSVTTKDLTSSSLFSRGIPSSPSLRPQICFSAAQTENLLLSGWVSAAGVQVIYPQPTQMGQMAPATHAVERYPWGQSDAKLMHLLSKWEYKAWACTIKDFKFVLQGLNVPFLCKCCSSHFVCWLECVCMLPLQKSQYAACATWTAIFEGWGSVHQL